jgi:Ca2+-binding EF-hand superfamily protein
MRWIFLCTGLLAGAATSVAGGGGPISWTEAFKAADTDGDHQISMSEVSGFSRQKEFKGFQAFMADHFVDFDTDGDGKVSEQELRLGIAKLGISESQLSQGFQEGFAFMPKD